MNPVARDPGAQDSTLASAKRSLLRLGAKAMGAAESNEVGAADVSESYNVRVSARLLERLQAADESPHTTVQMTGAERRQLVEAAYNEGASAVHQKMIELFQREQQKANEDLAELHARVEHPALDAVEAKVAKLHDREYRAPSRDVPCADERSECLRCLQANGDAPLSCADKVAALDKCAQAVSKVHLRSSTE